MVTSAEAVAILRGFLSSENSLRLLDHRPWVQVAVGEVKFDAAGVELVFFSDSANLDHLVSIRLPDGRQGSFTAWIAENGSNPIDELNEAELAELEQRLLDAA